MKRSGLTGDESPNDSAKSRIGGSTNFWPRMLATYDDVANIRRSWIRKKPTILVLSHDSRNISGYASYATCRKHRSMIRRCNSLHLSSQSPGSSTFSGSDVLNHVSHFPVSCCRLDTCIQSLQKVP